jgi:alkaline phosphatase D
VKNGVPYPAVLLMTGEYDGRVNPAHSRKMTARLQTATKSKEPVLLRTSSKSGHGIGTALNERIAQALDIYSFLMEQLGIDYSEVARGPWAGAVTPNSAIVKARLSHEGLDARLALSTSPLLNRPQFAPATRSATNHYNIVTFPLTGLKPDTEYHYALEVNGKLDRNKRGQFRTFPPEGNPSSFQFAFASCAETASTSEVFDRIRENRPLFYMNIGDFHYLNISSNDINRFYSAYDQVLASPEQADLYRSTAFNYNWDDHDFGGNNANRKASSHPSARAAYQEYVPHYPLPAGSGDVPIYHSFSVGRVKFIVTDLRSERSDPKDKEDENKTMMGKPQKEWFKQELLSANGKYPLIFWVSSVPWLGVRGSNYYNVRTNIYGFLHETNLTTAMLNVRTNRSTSSNTNSGSGDDHWSAYATERREIADFLKANNIHGLAILHGDAHMLGADDGRNSDFSTGGNGVRIPVMCGAPLDQSASLKGGPYSQGVYRFRRNEGGFGFVRVTDRGDEIEVRYSGLSNKNEEKISLQFKVPANSAKSQHTRR